MVAPVAHSSLMAHGAHHPRHANFGALNSAVRHGDIERAQQAYEALSTSSLPSAAAVRAKGSIDAIGEALALGDITSIREAVAAFQSHRTLVDPAIEAQTPDAPVSENPVTEVPGFEDPIALELPLERPVPELPNELLPDTAGEEPVSGETVSEAPGIEVPVIEHSSASSVTEMLLDALGEVPTLDDPSPEGPSLDRLA